MGYIRDWRAVVLRVVRVLVPGVGHFWGLGGVGVELIMPFMLWLFVVVGLWFLTVR